MNTYVYKDIYIGMVHSFERIVDQSMMQKFLEISGDNNPLHTEYEYALSKGFKNCVVYGLLTSAFYSTLVGVYLPGKYAILQGVDIQYSKPVFVGDKLIIKGVVAYINDSFKVIELKANIVNQDGIKISKAIIKIGLIDG
jgi:3-hydroxybutyryl-CoA dehydratase